MLYPSANVQDGTVVNKCVKTVKVAGLFRLAILLPSDLFVHVILVCRTTAE